MESLNVLTKDLESLNLLKYAIVALVLLFIHRIIIILLLNMKYRKKSEKMEKDPEGEEKEEEEEEESEAHQDQKKTGQKILSGFIIIFELLILIGGIIFIVFFMLKIKHLFENIQRNIFVRKFLSLFLRFDNRDITAFLQHFTNIGAIPRHFARPVKMRTIEPYGFAIKRTIEFLKSDNSETLLYSIIDLTDLESKAKSMYDFIQAIMPHIDTLYLDRLDSNNIMHSKLVQWLGFFVGMDFRLVSSMVELLVFNKLPLLVVLFNVLIILELFLVAIMTIGLVVDAIPVRFSWLILLFMISLSTMLVIAVGIAYMEAEAIIMRNIDEIWQKYDVNKDLKSKSKIVEDGIRILKILYNEEDKIKRRSQLLPLIERMRARLIDSFSSLMTHSLRIFDLRTRVPDHIPDTTKFLSFGELHAKFPSEIYLLPMLPIFQRYGLETLNYDEMYQLLQAMRNDTPQAMKEKIADDFIYINKRGIYYMTMMVNQVTYDPAGFLETCLKNFKFLDQLLLL